MTAEELYTEIMDKPHTDDEWLELKDKTKEFLNSGITAEERNMFVPLGAYEVLDMICAGIEAERKRNEGKSD